MPPRPALACAPPAILLMPPSPWLGSMAPHYHLLGHCYRGPVAGSRAFLLLPLVAWAVRRVAEERPFAVAALAVAYAALPLAHLPTAVLISLTAVPLYVLYRGWRLGGPRAALAFFGRCALGGALGLGLAAIYLLPALSLQHWISSDSFWTKDYQVDRWFLM